MATKMMKRLQPLLQGKTGRTGTVQRGEEKALGDLIIIYNNLKEDKKIEPISF